MRDCEEEETTKQAQIDSAKLPNRSLPIPAMSPTLSPTLSAMVAGLSGEFSSRSSSSFPTRSAPTSAAFVNIPPPTRPNNAMVDPPRPYPAIRSNRCSYSRSEGLGSRYKSIYYILYILTFIYNNKYRYIH